MGMQDGRAHSRPLNVAEPGPQDVDPGVPFPRGLADLVAYKLALQVAVRPDYERLCVAGLRLDVSRNLLLVLWMVSARVAPLKKTHMSRQRLAAVEATETSFLAAVSWYRLTHSLTHLLVG
jgi:hypothetical protein